MVGKGEYGEIDKKLFFISNKNVLSLDTIKKNTESVFIIQITIKHQKEI